ncbi:MULTISPECIES: hypothetical protein [unclassified Bradyrhizobium]|uniref:hypothetical protein n=1 Tax=unclassified Bradyrhizobium TaxID=2631580 RepID=UPI002FEEC513
MTTTFTIPERLWVAFAGALFVAVAAFGMIHVAPNRHLFPQNEITATIGLYLASILMILGVWMIADWRRKRRVARLQEYEDNAAAVIREVGLYLPAGGQAAADHRQRSRQRSAAGSPKRPRPRS